MKNIYRYILAFGAMAAAVSCMPETPYEPGEAEVDGCYGVYFPAQETDLVRDPSESRTATISVMRSNSEDAITVPLTVVDTSGLFTVSELVFEDGQSETTIDLSFEGVEVGVTYGVSFVIEDPQYASKYSSNPIALDFSVIYERWIDLGEGTWIEGANSYFSPFEEKVHIYQNDLDRNMFRVQMKWDTPDGVYAVHTEDADEYFNFVILQPGNKVYDLTISQEDLIYYDIYNTGYINSNYPDDPVQMLHPFGLVGATEAQGAYNHVLQYQDNGLPAAVAVAPFYYLMNAGGGWNQSTYDDVVTIVFPGAVLTDYSLSIMSGETTGGVLPLQFVTGEDVASVKYKIYEGTVSTGILDSYVAGIGDGSIEAEVAPEGAFGVKLGATGVYTVVAVSFDAAGAAQESASAEVRYVAEGDSMPVMAGAGIAATGKYGYLGDYYTAEHVLEYYIYGEDITAARALLLSSEEYAAYGSLAEVLLMSQPVLSAEVLAQINDGGVVGIYDERTPGTAYTFLVWLSNGYESTVLTAEASTAGSYDVTLSDMFGLYAVTGESYFNGPIAEPEAWILEPSDNPEAGNIMMTAFANMYVDSPIYGNFDAETRSLEFYDNQYVLAADGVGYLFFMNAETYDPISFSVWNEGCFNSPSSMFGLDVQSAPAGGQDLGWYDIYVDVSAVKVADLSEEASVSAESIKASALHEAGKVDAAPSVATPVEGVMGARVAEPAEYTVESLSGVVLENNIDRSSTQDYAVLLQK